LPLSLSRAIEQKKKDYYQAIKQAQRTNDLTEWIVYFTTTILEAQQLAKEQIEFTIQKTKLFDRYSDQLNDRQHKVITRMLAQGASGFEGGMNAKKYMSIAKTSKATATRDLQQLVQIGLLQPKGEGRSRKYLVKFL